MDKEAAIKKIHKCLALASSSEPHEAAAAMRQAQTLMKQFGVEHPELLAAEVSEDWAKSSASKTPTRYEVVLASTVAGAFGCDLVFCRRLDKSGFAIEGGYAFIGVTPSPEVASYTYAVLRRQLLKARARYVKAALKRYSKNKTSAADLFCEGWIVAVRRLIAAVAPTAEQARAIDAYMRINHAALSALAPREAPNAKSLNAMDHKGSGYMEGQLARLDRSVTNSQPVMIGAR